MQQVIFEVLIPFFISLLMLCVSFVIGNFIFDKLRINQRYGSLFNFAISSILGFGLVANISLILSLLNILNVAVVWSIVAVVLVVGRKKIINLVRQILSFWEGFGISTFLEGLLIFLIAIGFLFYLVSTFSPPYKNDAIAYHLPNTIEIANGNLLSMGGYGKWSENMPILIETLYAWLYQIGGFNLINLCHYQLVLLLFLAVYSIIKNEFSRLGGLIATFLFFGFHPLMTHSTDAYIDGGILTFELSGILLFFLWVKYKDSGWLSLSGSMYGLALASKYVPLYSFTAIMIFFIVFNLWHRVSVKVFIFNCLRFFIPVFLFSGFWYIKNLILLHNPFYPFIFNHNGLGDRLMETELFKSRYYTGGPLIEVSLLNFVLLPYKFFWSINYTTILISFLFSPFGFLVSENKIFFRVLMCLAVVYFTIWYFFVSNIIRYGLPGPILLMMAAGVIIAWLVQNKFRIIFAHWLFKIFVVIAFFIFFTLVFIHRNNYIVASKITEVKYVLGIINKTEFYRLNQLGELFEASNFINQNYFGMNVVNNWDGFNIFLENNNKFISFSGYLENRGTISTSTICSYFANNKTDLIFINHDYRQRVVDDWWGSTIGVGDIFKKNNMIENDIILSGSQVIFEKYSGRLYHINICK